METEAQSRALDVCIINMQAGEKLEQVLELYPQWSKSLTAPLEAAQVLRIYTESLPVTQADQDLGRSSFMENAQYLSKNTGLPAVFSTRWTWLAWLALILFLLAGVFGCYVITSLALPGETLYPFKEMARRVRLLMEDNPAQKLELERTFDQAHLDEVKTLAGLNRLAEFSLVGLLKQDQPDAWTVGEYSVRVTPQTRLVGKVQEGIWVEVVGELQPGGAILVKQIRPREYIFEGTLQEISPEMLVISGIPVKLTNETLVHGSPMAGSKVRVAAFRVTDDSLLARLVDTIE
jgi:hypothetical protein